MKIFVVNLDKNTDRMEFMDGQLNRLGLQYERIPAVYGKTMSSAELGQMFSRTRSLWAQRRRLSLSEIGCSLSHVKIYRTMIQENIPVALVLEDDVVLDSRLQDVLSGIESFISMSKPQVVMLSDHGRDDDHKTGIERAHFCICTDGYVVNLPAAQLIYMANYPVLTVADKWDRWEKRSGLETYRAYPVTVRQDNEHFASDMWPKRTPEEIKAIKRKAILMRPLKLVYIMLDRLCFWFTGR